MTAFTISRRSMLSGVAVTILGGVAGFVVARQSDLASTKRATTGANGYGAAPQTGRLLASVGQIPPGGGVILSDQRIVLTRGAGGTVHAFSAVCTHQGCTVNSIDNGVISCPCHGSQFSAENGSVLTGPASSPLPTVNVVERGGNIYTG
jgi:Rieske Fe-S protein